jgi:hypothetical protein
MAIVFVAAMIIISLGPENRGISFRKSAVP